MAQHQRSALWLFGLLTAACSSSASKANAAGAPAGGSEQAGTGGAGGATTHSGGTSNAGNGGAASSIGGSGGGSAGSAGAPTPPPIVGVYVGNSTADVLAHEAWLGRSVDGVLGYTGNASWTDYDGSVGWAAGNSMWGALDRRILWSVPLIPTGATLTDAAAGSYDAAHYKAAATILKDFRPQEPVLHVRTAWEYNGDWFPWACTSSTCLNDFIGAFRHFVDSFRSVSSRFRITFCPNVGRANASYALEDSYPGDRYVDVIGIDLYAGWYPTNTTTPAARWQYQLDREYGLNWLASFAAQHNKPLAIPEWGVGDHGSGDDPVFVQGMHDFCEAHHCVYLSYWDSNSAYLGELRNNQYPNAAAKYRALFGTP